MSEITLVLDKKNLSVQLETDTIRIDAPGRGTERMPLNLLKQVVVHGRPMVSCDVWRALADRNIPAVLLPSRGKGGPAYLGAGLSVNTAGRAVQHAASGDPERAMAVSRWLLRKKLSGQVNVLKEIGAGNDGVASVCGKIRGIAASLEKAADNNSLMGREGAAAAAYFKGVKMVLPAKWKFSGRNRRPPRDPVNGLLSLSYALAFGEALRAVQVRGLDPCLSFFHKIQPGRESLVLDIMEPLRPEIDRFVFGLLDHPMGPGDFTQSKHEGCRLSKDGRRAFYQEWAVWRQGEDDAGRRFDGMVRDVVRGVIAEMGGKS